MNKRYSAQLFTRHNPPLILKEYHSNYQQSIDDPATFWAREAEKYLSWNKRWDEVISGDFAAGDSRWFAGAELNVCYNCVDRHLPAQAAQTAILWEGDKPGQKRVLTYLQLHEQVCRLANVLKAHGIQKGDRVGIYLPMIPEAVVAMLACCRIGTVHSVVFGGFSAESLANRLQDAECSLVITADAGMRGGKQIPLKENVDTALLSCPKVRSVIVVKNTEVAITWNDQRDHWYEDEIQRVSHDCPCVSMAADDPLFIFYTSGSTGKPKGVLHTTAGYLLFAASTFRTVFDYQAGETYWCTADVGWITGHSYIVYGPLANCATTVLFEGIPNYPEVSRYWEIIDEYKVNIFYTAPTALRALMRYGDKPVQKTNRASLRVLGTVGEPINPEVWEWYYRVVGEERCPIVDTWWQTETGGMLITPIFGLIDLKPGSASLPYYGVKPGLVDDQGKLQNNSASGNLVIQQSWPGLMRTVYGNHQRFIDIYFKQYPGMYCTGDGARRDEDGYYWITGRVDDVINTAGHRIGTAELESALVSHPQIAEAAVVSFPHAIKGEGIYAFVVTKVGVHPEQALKNELIAQVKQQIGALAKPDEIQWAKALPKTRSGKIMRRILRKIAAGETDDLGDISTLADSSVINDLLADHSPQK